MWRVVGVGLPLEGAVLPEWSGTALVSRRIFAEVRSFDHYSDAQNSIVERPCRLGQAQGAGRVQLDAQGSAGSRPAACDAGQIATQAGRQDQVEKALAAHVLAEGRSGEERP